MLIRCWAFCVVLVAAAVATPTAFGQGVPSSEDTVGGRATLQTTTAPQQAAPSTPPPTTVGQSAKPTRGFFPALVHNLGDDVKHIPRRNSVYWLAGGAALALAVHPADKDLNAHLVGHSNPFVAGEVIGETTTILGASAATYLVGRMKSYPRVEH